MSFFKKIFGEAEVDRLKNLVQRAPRVSITPLHRISFVEKYGGVKIPLANISTTGIALLRAGLGWLPAETRGGFLMIDRDEFQIQLKVRHVSGKLAGCELVSPENPALKRAIEVYLRVEILALTLRLVNEAYLQPDPRGKTIWYTNGRQNEVFVVVDDDGVVAYHMCFLGNYVEGSRGQAPRVGELRESEAKTLGHKGSTLVDLGGPLAGSQLNLALSFIRNVDQLAPAVRSELVAQLSKAQSG